MQFISLSSSYDGQGPDAYFYVGEKGEPSGNGILIADEKGTTDILGSYRNKDIVLTLPGRSFIAIFTTVVNTLIILFNIITNINIFMRIVQAG